MADDQQDLKLDQIIVAMTPRADHGFIRQVIFTSRLIPIPNDAVASAWRSFAHQCEAEQLSDLRNSALIEAARLTPMATESAQWQCGQSIRFSDLETSNTRSVFKEHGFVHVTGILEQSEVDEFKRLSERRVPMVGAWRPENGANVFKELPEARFMAVHPKLHQTLSTLTGTAPILLVEQANLMRGLRTHWHTDTVLLEKGGRTFADPDDLLLTVLIYPQRADPFFGGGIDVFPGSHKLTEHRQPEGPFYPVPTRPGDIVVLDSRLWHRGGPAPISDPDRPVKALMTQTWAKNERSGTVFRDAYQAGEDPFVKAMRIPMDPAFFSMLDAHQVRWM